MNKAEEKPHLEFIRQLQCLVCGASGVEAAHVRYADARVGKPITGMRIKPHGWVVPLCTKHHREQHKGNERAFWIRHNIDPILVSLALYKCSGDFDVGDAIIRHAYFNS